MLLRVLRLRSGQDQGALARELGVSQSRVSRWERGVGLPEAPQVAAWLRLCAVEAETQRAVLSLLELAQQRSPAADVGLRRLLLAQLGGLEDSAGLPGPGLRPGSGPQAASGGSGPADAWLAGSLEALGRVSGLSYDTSVPFFADVAAGLGEVQAPRYGPQAQIPVPADVLRRDPSAYALRVRGDSMLPLLAEGDIVVVSPRSGVFEGCIVAARVDPDGDVVKQYRRLPDGRVQLVPLNSAYPLITLRAAREAISALADRGVSVPPDALEREGQEGQLWGRVVLQLRDL